MATKILYVIGDLDVGGAERHLVQVLPKLVQLNFAPTVYTLTHKGKLAPTLERAGISVIEPIFASGLHRLPSWIRKPTLLLLTVFSLYRLLWRLRPSVVHFFLPAAYLLGGFCSLSAGVSHLRIMSRRSLNHYQSKHPIFARLEHLLHRQMDAVLGNSKAVTDELRNEGVPESRLGLLYNGINLADFDLPTRHETRQKLGISEDALLLACVANLIPYKGHADLISALGMICSDMPADWVIAVVGRDSGIKAELQKLAEDRGLTKHILWLGERSDSVAIYSASDIGILCSHEEGFSNSILEGMAAGAAMVVTDVGGNAEAVLDGQCGLVVPPHNPDLLGRAILNLARDADARQRMASMALKRVQNFFSLDGCVNQYANLYRVLLREPDSPVQNALTGHANVEIN